MIKFDQLRPYTHIVKSIRFPIESKNPYLILYFSENSFLSEDYFKLNLSRIDFKNLIIPMTTIPRSNLTGEEIKYYKQFGLYAITQKMRIPENKNIIIDSSKYCQLIDSVYNPKTYRMRAGSMIMNFIDSLFNMFPANYKKVLLYSIDITKPFNNFVDRKIFPFIKILKDEDKNLIFDSLLFNTLNDKSSSYRLLIKDKKFNFNRVFYLLKDIKYIESEDDEKEELSNNISNQVTNSTINNNLINPENKEKVQNAVKNYLKSSPKELNKMMDKDRISSLDSSDLVSTSIMASTMGDYKKAERMNKLIPPMKKEKTLKLIDSRLGDELLPKEIPINTSNDLIVNSSNIPKMIENKSPEHIFKKRQIDFHVNLKKDMSNSFKILGDKEIPLKLISINIIDKQIQYGEIEKSDQSMLIAKLQDPFGNIHDVTIDLPRIDPISGIFRLDGIKTCLINQIILCPISFPKPYDSKFESSYSAFHIASKRMRSYQYLEIYISSYKLPLSILLFYSFGFEETLKKYDIKYILSNEKPNKSEYQMRLKEDLYITFENVNTDLKKQFILSFIKSDIYKYKIDKEFGNHLYFNDLIIWITGRVNSTYKIKDTLENIVDPIVRQVLMNQGLPIYLEDIIHYMSEKVITGFYQERNDLSNQRVRSSEILVMLTQKQLLATYTSYKEQVLSGNKNAKFIVSPTKVLSDFRRQEVVTTMEYGNPIEEMATLTKISPVGKQIGGIPGKDAVQMDMRTVHSSYFGSIDPLDTPEGGNIGISQQLSIDAALTSSRGLIKTKKLDLSEKSGLLSTSTCMIPFVENNDGARIIMAANQARQAIPLKNPESPAVQSGYESLLPNVLSSNFIKRAHCDGIIKNITKDNITIICKDKKRDDISIIPSTLKSGAGKNTLSVFRPIVEVGQKVKTNQIVAEGSCIDQGSIAMGRSLAMAVFPYKGYNFEDGIVINEKLVEEDKLTSLHLIEENVTISPNDRLLYINEIGKNTTRGEHLLRKTMGDVEELIGYKEDEESEILPGQQFIKKSQGGIIVEIEVFSNLKKDKFPQLIPLIDRTNRKYNKPENERYTIKRLPIKGILIRFKIQQELKINLGDKLTNRYGGKGIVSLLEKDSLMPRTPWGDRIDIIINPLGIINRMNIGQLYELYCGLISRTLASNILNMKKESAIQHIHKIINILDNTKDKIYSNSLILSLKSFNDSKYQKMLQQVKTKKFFPILIPPFAAPNYKMIKEALKQLNLETGYHLYIPEYNVKTKSKVPVGYMYMYKLEHMGDMKIHSRSTGPTIGKLFQPTAGKAQDGGQRLGELDTYSFISYGATKTLQELMGPMSDDYVSKNEMLSEIIQNGYTTYKKQKVNPTQDLLKAYFIAMMIE